MAKYIGRRLDIGIGRETTRGTAVSPAYRLPHVSFDFDDQVTKARSDAGLGRLEDSEEAFVTTRWGEGSIEGEVRAQSFGLLLYAMLGSLSTAGPTDSAYTHSFTLSNDNQHQSLTLVTVDPNTSEAYKLVMLNELELTAELDEIVQYNASFLSKRGNDTDKTVPALADEPKFTKKHVRVKVAADTGSLSGASALSIKSLTLTISKNVVMDDVLFTAEPEDFLNTQISVEGELTLNYEDETWKDYMTTPTDRAMEIALVNTDETISSGSTNPSLTIQMPKVDFFDWAGNYALDEIVTQTISFKGNYDTANAASVISTCDLVNSVSSY